MILYQIVWLTFWGCSFNSDTEANELYVSASLSMNLAMNEAEDYTKSFESYDRALVDIEQILSDYKSSKVATSLSSGLIKVSGYSLNEFRSVQIPLETLANAEHSPSVAALVIKQIDGLTPPPFLINSSTDEIDLSMSRRMVEMMHSDFYEPQEAGKAKKRKEVSIKIDSSFTGDIINAVESDISIESGNYQRALRFIQLIEDDKYRVQELVNLGRAYVDAGLLSDASQMLSQAYESAQLIEDDKYRVQELVNLGRAYVDAGLLSDASQMLSQAYESAQLIEDDRNRAKSLVSIADVHIKAGNQNESIMVTRNALETTRSITKTGPRSSTFVEIVRAFAEAGDFALALQVSELIQNETHLNIAFAEIAAVYTNAHLFIEGNKTIDNITTGMIKDAALAGIAGNYAEAGKLKEALTAVLGIEDNYIKAIAMSAIGSEVNKASLVLSKEDLTIAQEVIHKVFPIETFWE